MADGGFRPAYNSAMAAIASCGLGFRVIINENGERERYRQPALAPWEQWRTDPAERRPLHPQVREERAAARRRWRERKHERERERAAALLAKDQY